VRFENDFAVPAPIDEVWNALLDVERVAPCMPGAEVLERVGDDAYKVGVTIKVGPISMTYRGEVQIVERDEQARRATMRVRAKEARGQGTADARARMTLAERSNGTDVTIESEVQLSGKVAAMGQGIIADVSAKLVETFAENLAAMLADGEAAGGAAAVDGGRGGTPTATATVSVPAAAPTPAPAKSTVPVGKIAAAVIAGRLVNPRTLLLVAVAYAAIFLAIGFLIGRLT
jgi:carbon monoxide dehydrogenase subunit G